MTATLHHPSQAAGFHETDTAFGEFIARFGGGEPIARVAACLSRAVRQGHICLDLKQPPEGAEGDWFSASQWRERLACSPAVAFVRQGEELPVAPLVLDPADRLYLRRFYLYEQELAAALLARSDAGASTPAEGQAAAVATALAQRLTIISGGPGTGKTTTVLKILAGLVKAGDGLLPRVVLTAPTGKAAARLEEAVRNGVDTLPEEDRSEALDRLLAQLPRAATLDRLLGTRPGTAALRHHADNPLPVDVAIVDEASMVALPAMARFLAALPPQARVILLGDRDQLASVAPGSLLADLAEAAARPGNPLAGSLVTLVENFRFKTESGIHRFCQAIRRGESAGAVQILDEGGYADLGSHPLPSPDRLSQALTATILDGYGPFLREREPERALASFAQFRLLAAVREGPYGVSELNRLAEAILREHRLIGESHHYYAGLPVLIRRNDYTLRLFNGDIGILLPDPSDPAGSPRLWAWFPNDPLEQQAGGPAVRRIAPSRLPEHETAYAMTVHKSQGSEFDRVALILPGHESAVVTRELIYTGVTRARKQVDLWFEPEAFTRGVARRAERVSGLGDALEP
ncbi:MAG TPA: exodeoxyribonuclease V subunit alpha [Chthoniobacteraceae bacterium]|nr:exodeoxyribonuclease V subunit alpha [Chthoniobacteraceae bacterium]